ncbi:MAG TPA: YciI family protein, partial [Burkholderiaceae bacterium]|nr:YciI family protein [Burkholderiaceae bacterium]
DVFRFGGPLLGDDGAPVGSLMLLELPDRAALGRHLQADPFFGSGLFQQVSVWTSQQVVPELEPGALDAEIARQRMLADAVSADGAR